MADFTEHFLRGLQAGQSAKQQRETQANDAEDRQMRQQILKHQLASAKLEDLVQAYNLKRQAAQGQVDAQQGQPQASFMESIPQAPAGSLAPGVELPQNGGASVNTGPRPVTFPGLPNEIGGGSPSYQQTPKSMEEIIHAQTAAKLRDATLTPQKLGPGENVVIPALGPQPIASGGAPKQDEWQAFQSAYSNQLGKPDWSTLSPDEQMRGFSQFAQSKQTPETAELQKLRMTLLQVQAGQQPTREDALTIAQQVVNHKLAPSQVQLFGGFGTAGAAFKRMVGTELAKVDPNFDWEEAESTYQLVKSPSFQGTIRYMQSVQESMPQLQKTADALNNGRVKFVNGLKNLTKDQLNVPKLKAFQTDVLLVGDEVAKILQGGGTGSATSDAKLSQAAQILGQSDSPAAIKAALAEISTLIGFRGKALTRGTYMESQFSGESPKEIVYDTNGNVVQ